MSKNKILIYEKSGISFTLKLTAPSEINNWLLEMINLDGETIGHIIIEEIPDYTYMFVPKDEKDIPEKSILKFGEIQIYEGYRYIGLGNFLMEKLFSTYINIINSNKFKQMYLYIQPFNGGELNSSCLFNFYRKFGFKNLIVYGFKNTHMIINL